MVKKNGEEIDVEIHSIAIFDEGRNFVRTRSIIRDLTQETKAEEGAQIFSQAFTTSLDGISITDLHGNIIYSNKSAATIYGYEEGELLRKHVDILNSDKGFSNRMMVPEIKDRGGWSGE